MSQQDIIEKSFKATFSPFFQMALSKLFVDTLVAFIKEFGLFGIFLTMTAESCLIPIPSEVIMPFAGYTAWLNGSKEFIVYSTIAATIGNLIGSVVLYYIGLKLGRPFIKKYGRYFLVGEKELRLVEEWFLRYGAYAIFFGRMMPAVRTVISFPVGLFGFNIRKFMILTFTGSIPWNLALTYAGYMTGPYWNIILEYSAYADVAVVVAIILAVVLIYRRLKSGS
ncbi:MAG: DedA family protein [Nitrososphaerota archaeon]